MGTQFSGDTMVLSRLNALEAANAMSATAGVTQPRQAGGAEDVLEAIRQASAELQTAKQELKEQVASYKALALPTQQAIDEIRFRLDQSETAASHDVNLLWQVTKRLCDQADPEWRTETGYEDLTKETHHRIALANRPMLEMHPTSTSLIRMPIEHVRSTRTGAAPARAQQGRGVAAAGVDDVMLPGIPAAATPQLSPRDWHAKHPERQPIRVSPRGTPRKNYEEESEQRVHGTLLEL